MPPCQGAPAVELYWETDDSTQPDRPDTENTAKKATFNNVLRRPRTKLEPAFTYVTGLKKMFEFDS